MSDKKKLSSLSYTSLEEHIVAIGNKLHVLSIASNISFYLTANHSNAFRFEYECDNFVINELGE